MLKKAVFCFMFISIFALPNLVFGEISIGVKPGDWIEYNVSTTGSPPVEHDVVWARMEITQVQGPQVTVNVTTQVQNGSLSSLVMTLNIEEGEIGAWWIIPANLGPGETFYDSFLNTTITIDGQEQLVYAGAERTVTNASIPTRFKRWDKATGVFLVSMDDFSDYTIDVIAYNTNMWNPTILGLDNMTFYLIVIAVVLVVVIAILGIFMYRKGKRA